MNSRIVRPREIRTPDEFGVLARDPNLFLDRIGRIVGELDAVLSKVVSANDDIIAIQADLRQQVDGVVSRMRCVERDAMLSAKREPHLSNAWFDAVRGLVEELERSLAGTRQTGAAGELLETLRQVVDHAEAQLTASETVFGNLAAFGDQSETLKESMLEMTRLEERSKNIIETCGSLEGRLQPDGGTRG